MVILQIRDEIELISRALTRSATHLCHPPWKNSSRKIRPELEGARTKLRLDIMPNTPKANLDLISPATRPEPTVQNGNLDSFLMLALGGSCGRMRATLKRGGAFVGDA